jgi:mannose/fructose/N-acetylgalactosamine-specific phosphotransferase system component IIC
MNAIVNYTLNKFCPYIVIGFLLLYNSDIDIIRSVIILGACLFIEKFSFKTGYSVAYCEKNNINLDD